MTKSLTWTILTELQPMAGHEPATTLIQTYTTITPVLIRGLSSFR